MGVLQTSLADPYLQAPHPLQPKTVATINGHNLLCLQKGVGVWKDNGMQMKWSVFTPELDQGIDLIVSCWAPALSSYKSCSQVMIEPTHTMSLLAVITTPLHLFKPALTLNPPAPVQASPDPMPPPHTHWHFPLAFNFSGARVREHDRE